MQKTNFANSWAAAVAIVATSMVASALVLKLLPVPFFWVGLIGASAGIALGAGALRFARLPLVAVSSILFAFALAELLASIRPELTLSINPNMYRGDPVLGWSPKPSQVSRATERLGDQIIYDVVYSFDAAGRRIAPPDIGRGVEGCLFFFADSFAFGEGVNDSETFPYQVGLKTQGRFRILNFSFSGYGAEQMLASLERGELASNPPCEPTHVFYAALPHHVLRAAGKTDYSVRGPRYRLGANGTLQYVGTDWNVPRPHGWQARLTDQLMKSRLYRDWATREPTATEADIASYFAIVKQSFRLLRQRWPNARLYVISWDIDDQYSNGLARFHSGLEATGAKVLYIDDILPGYSIDLARYTIQGSERHPNPLAYRLVASYLAQHVLPPGPGVSRSITFQEPRKFPNRLHSGSAGEVPVRPMRSTALAVRESEKEQTGSNAIHDADRHHTAQKGGQ